MQAAENHQQQALQQQQQQQQQQQHRPQQPQQRQYKPREGGGEKPVEVNQSMPIPADRVGWIIGKQGVYIQGLSQRSGCAISVSDSPSKEFGRCECLCSVIECVNIV